MKHAHALSAVAAALCLASSVSHALAFKYVFPTQMIADGSAGQGEWNAAGAEVDTGGATYGSIYAGTSMGYTPGYGSYDGRFLYLMHNIERNTDDFESDYNVFDIFGPNDATNPKLTVWVFDDDDNPTDTDAGWVEAAGLPSAFASGLNDRGFLVRNNADGTFTQWLPGALRPEDGGYPWDTYLGVYARGGYNNSAFESGLLNAIDTSNQVFEIFYKAPAGDNIVDGTQIRRSALDPDVDPRRPPIVYIDIVIDVPAPATPLLFAAGLGALGIGRRRLSKGEG